MPSCHRFSLTYSHTGQMKVRPLESLFGLLYCHSQCCKGSLSKNLAMQARRWFQLNFQVRSCNGSNCQISSVQPKNNNGNVFSWKWCYQEPTIPPSFGLECSVLSSLPCCTSSTPCLETLAENHCAVTKPIDGLGSLVLTHPGVQEHVWFTKFIRTFCLHMLNNCLGTCHLSLVAFFSHCSSAGVCKDVGFSFLIVQRLGSMFLDGDGCSKPTGDWQSKNADSNWMPQENYPCNCWVFPWTSLFSWHSSSWTVKGTDGRPDSKQTNLDMGHGACWLGAGCIIRHAMKKRYFQKRSKEQLHMKYNMFNYQFQHLPVLFICNNSGYSPYKHSKDVLRYSAVGICRDAYLEVTAASTWRLLPSKWQVPGGCL